jgi:hypothetical protein
MTAEKLLRLAAEWRVVAEDATGSIIGQEAPGRERQAARAETGQAGW